MDTERDQVWAWRAISVAQLVLGVVAAPILFFAIPREVRWVFVWGVLAVGLLVFLLVRRFRALGLGLMLGGAGIITTGFWFVSRVGGIDD